MTIRLCPSCARLVDMIPPPDCPICGGVGHLVLGRGGMDKHGATVCSLAVEMALEKQARADLGHRYQDLGLARANQTKTVEEMRKVGLLAKTGTDSGRSVIKSMTIAEHRERAAVLAGATREDTRRLSTPRLDWDVDDRPLAAGGPPGFSSGGFVAHLTRVNDPQDPLAMGGIAEQARKRVKDRRYAAVLANLIPLFDI